MEELYHCPSCNSQAFNLFISCKDYTVSKETFNIVSCNHCTFKFTNPRPDVAAIGRYYESDDYISHSNSKKGLFNRIYQIIRNISINKKIKLIADLNPKNKTILDIGCGTGEFLGAIKKEGWTSTGIEPNDKAREAAIQNHSINVYPENGLRSLKENSFDVITMWHVLEHVHDLQQRIKELYNLLSVGGYTIIAVPNHTAWDANHYGVHWAAYDVPRHLYHFSPSIIKKLFKENGFSHLKSLPMTFDSFYVSLLSEKYKGSTLAPVRAVMNGMRSNLKAKNDPEKYSSVIYIFKK